MKVFVSLTLLGAAAVLAQVQNLGCFVSTHTSLLHLDSSFMSCRNIAPQQVMCVLLTSHRNLATIRWAVLPSTISAASPVILRVPAETNAMVLVCAIARALRVEARRPLRVSLLTPHKSAPVSLSFDDALVLALIELFVQLLLVVPLVLALAVALGAQ